MIVSENDKRRGGLTRRGWLGFAVLGWLAFTNVANLLRHPDRSRVEMFLLLALTFGVIFFADARARLLRRRLSAAGVPKKACLWQYLSPRMFRSQDRRLMVEMALVTAALLAIVVGGVVFFVFFVLFPPGWPLYITVN